MGQGGTQDLARDEGLSSTNPMMTKHIAALVAAIVLGMLTVAWLMLAPPSHDPPHPSYLPAK